MNEFILNSHDPFLRKNTSTTFFFNALLYFSIFFQNFYCKNSIKLYVMQL